MPNSMLDYLSHARRFERLAAHTRNEEIKRLMLSQADACYRLALQKRREDVLAIPYSPPSMA